MQRQATLYDTERTEGGLLPFHLRQIRTRQISRGFALSIMTL
jgi:hypothetical protein